MADQFLTFVSSGAATAIVSLIAVHFLKGYLSSYVEEKGKNLATKEDIGAITREVERVRHDYSALLEQLKARNQLRMAALDKRLQVHQEAFTNWRKLFTSNPEDMDAVAQQCRDWWNLNCLYLEPQVREAYLDAVSQEYRRRALQSRMTLAQFLPEQIEKMFAFPNLLFKAIQLPALSEVEQSALQSNERTKGTSAT
jgi:hypothetical protein